MSASVLKPQQGANEPFMKAAVDVCLPKDMVVAKGLPSLVDAVGKPTLYGTTETFVVTEFDSEMDGFLGSLRLHMKGKMQMLIAPIDRVVKKLGPESTLKDAMQLFTKFAEVDDKVPIAKEYAQAGLVIQQGEVPGDKPVAVVFPACSLVCVRTVEKTYGLRYRFLAKDAATKASLNSMKPLVKDKRVGDFLDLALVS